jgi:hypothetical protein
VVVIELGLNWFDSVPAFAEILPLHEYEGLVFADWKPVVAVVAWTRVFD